MNRKEYINSMKTGFSILRQSVITRLAFFALLLIPSAVHAQEVTNDSDLINSFIRAKGYTQSIVFDKSNIKQFWIDKSVISQKDFFTICNTPGYSTDASPLKIQLANVNEAQDCKIEMITETSDVAFSIFNSKNKSISSSQKDDDFINYHVFSSVFHLEDTQNTSFYVKFSAPLAEINIKKIILSFSTNKNGSFLAHPGKTVFNKDNIETISKLKELSDNSFEITGKRTKIQSTKNFLISDHPFNLSVKAKNTGKETTRLYVGYAIYTKNRKVLSPANYPYKDTSKILTVISSVEGSDKIIVDSLPEWRKESSLAVNVKEDMSDIPECSFVDGTIVDVKEIENGHAEITLDKPVVKGLEKGTKVRVHGVIGAFIYTNIVDLQPGQEELLSSTIAKDDAYLQYSSKAFSRGVYYAVPMIRSYSSNPNNDNTILITDFSISY